MPNESPDAPPAGQADPVAAPVLTVIRGEPTAAELAAVLAVLVARASAGAADLSASAGANRSAWSERSGMLRESLSPGPGAWKRSALPR